MIKVEIEFIYHHKKSSWGRSVLIMAAGGVAFARIYWYNNDEKTAYLDMLSVNEEYRKCGIGTELQKIRELIAISTGATEARLWVDKDSWMHEWYKRRGYTDYADYEHVENCVWMSKRLRKEKGL